MFWKVPITSQKPGRLTDAILEGESSGQIKLTGKEAEEFTDKFFKLMWEEADRDAGIVRARQMYKELHDQAIRLFTLVKKEIIDWAK